MKFLITTLALLSFANLGYSAAPPILTIGDISDANTEFNVGEGNTNETTSYNHIQIVGTAGLDLGLTNNPNTTLEGTKYYQFTILKPGCEPGGDLTAVGLKTTYDTDGHLTSNTTVDLELSVNAWDATPYDLAGNFGVCIQADIMMVNDALESVVIERKNFDFVVTPILSTFSVTSGLKNNTVDVGSSQGELSGTGVTPLWKGNDPLPPGEPVWFQLTVNDTDYNFVEFETVTMMINGVTSPLIANKIVADSSLTSWELATGSKVIHFYHILPRSNFGATPQSITMTGKALVDYIPVGARRLRGADDRDLATTDPTESVFEIQATLMADEGGDSGSFSVEILSVVIGGVGAIGAAML